MENYSCCGSSLSSVSFMTFPKNEIAKNMIYNRMKCHYRRIVRAKAKVDTNLPKPPKNSVPLSREICDIVDRNYYCYRNLPRHRKCLKELEEAGFHFKPIILNSNAESKLKTLDVYYPPVRTPHRTRSRQSKSDISEEQIELVEEELNELVEPEFNRDVEEQKTVIEKTPVVDKKETSVQTERLPKQKTRKEATFRPLNARALDFLRDITDDVLSKGVYTDESLERIFSYHVDANKYSLDVETMLNEIDRLKDEVGIPRPGLRRSRHSDEEAIAALNSLQLDPVFKEDIITSLRLNSRESYHSAVFESQSSSSSELLKFIKSEKAQSVSSNHADSIQEKLLQHSEHIEEVKSTASEVSDIEDDNSLINGEQVSKSSSTKKSHTKSCNSNRKERESMKENLHRADSLNQTENHCVSRVNNKESDSATNGHSEMNKDSVKDEETMVDNEPEVKSISENNSSGLNAAVHEEADYSEDEADSVDEGKRNSNVEQRSKSDDGSSSEMSSVHTEPSIDF